MTVLEVVCPENFIRNIPQNDGRPEADRVNLACAFLAKAVWDIPTTRALIERLEVDPRLRNLCGWIFTREIPSESTFSRAFAEFAESDLAGRMHEASIKETLGQSIVGPVSRDSTAIPAREKPTGGGAVRAAAFCCDPCARETDAEVRERSESNETQAGTPAEG